MGWLRIITNAYSVRSAQQQTSYRKILMFLHLLGLSGSLESKIQFQKCHLNTSIHYYCTECTQHTWKILEKFITCAVCIFTVLNFGKCCQEKCINATETEMEAWVSINTKHFHAALRCTFEKNKVKKQRGSFTYFLST